MDRNNITFLPVTTYNSENVITYNSENYSVCLHDRPRANLGKKQKVA